MLKKILIVLAIIFAITILIMVALFVYVNNVYIPKNLRPIVIEVLEKSLDKDVTIEEAKYFPFKGVMFSKVDITNRDATPFLKVEKVDLNLKGFPKFEGKNVAAQATLLVHGIDFEQESIQVKGSSTINVDLRSEKGEAPEFKAVILLDNLSVTGIGTVSDITQIQGDITCTENAFYTENLKALISAAPVEINAKGKYSKDAIDLDTFNLTYVNTNIYGNALLTGTDAPKIKTQLNGNINFLDVTKIISGVKLPALSGDFVFELKAQGSVADIKKLDAVITASIENASVDKIKFSKFQTQITLKDGIATLAPTTCDFYEGKIQAKGKAEVLDSKLPIEVSADVMNVNVAPLAQDIMGEDMGGGFFEAHAGIYGSITDLNLLTGGGRLKLEDGTLKMPDNFKKIANALKVAKLNEMRINEVSATFTIKDGKVDSQDILMLSQEAMITGKGYADIDQYIDSEFKFKLTHEFARTLGSSEIINFVSDEQGVPIGGVKLFGKIPDIRYEPFGPPLGDMIKNKVKNIGDTIKEAITGQMQGESGDTKEESSSENVEDAIKKGLKNLFK